MKFLTKEQENELWNANVAGGLRGAAYAGAIGIPGLWALQRYSPRFRAVPLTVTALGVVVATFPFISVGAEKAGEAYQQSLWTGVGLKELTVEQQRAEDRWEHLTTSEKVKDWAGKQQYRLVGGSWVASMVIAGAIVARNPSATFPQKLVQARMWAQGLTVAVLIASGVLSGVNAQTGFKAPEDVDHSWRTILEESQKEEQRQKAAKVRLPTRTERPLLFGSTTQGNDMTP